MFLMNMSTKYLTNINKFNQTVNKNISWQVGVQLRNSGFVNILVNIGKYLIFNINW